MYVIKVDQHLYKYIVNNNNNMQIRIEHLKH